MGRTLDRQRQRGMDTGDRQQRQREKEGTYTMVPRIAPITTAIIVSVIDAAAEYLEPCAFDRLRCVKKVWRVLHIAAMHTSYSALDRV